MKALSIGQVARQAGFGVETVRFYERQGLLEKPPRKESGYRQYPPEAVSRLHFIKKAKEVGFSLKEIKELLLLRLDSAATCQDVRSRAEAKILDIKQKIQALTRMKQALTDLTKACSGRGSVSECPILQSFEEKKDW
ncbi:MAG: MerR family DNA-binding protein [Planctomycetes bacterium]|nr:MerR family DNA-binding protein [Planctomycetota bacterium]MCH8118868.1 MerR family DNA-binding protein [Planctomycetota bacterium]